MKPYLLFLFIISVLSQSVCFADQDEEDEKSSFRHYSNEQLASACNKK